MVSGSLKLFFNLLTAFNWLLDNSLAFASVTLFFGIKVNVLHFSRKRQDGCLGENTCLLQPALKRTAHGLEDFFDKSMRTLRFIRIFFPGFRRKHLFITTCIEKHCTRTLSFLR